MRPVTSAFCDAILLFPLTSLPVPGSNLCRHIVNPVGLTLCQLRLLPHFSSTGHEATSAFRDAISLFPLTSLPVPGSNLCRHIVNPIGLKLCQLRLLPHFSSTSHVAGHICLRDAILLFPLTSLPVPGSNLRRHTVNPIGLKLCQLRLLPHFSSTSHVAGHICLRDAILLFPLTSLPVPGSNLCRHTVNPIGLTLCQLILLRHFSSNSHVASHTRLPWCNPFVSSHLPTSTRQQSQSL